MLVVRCPGCGNTMKTDPRGPVNKSVKECVYCGRSFKVHSGPRDTRIVRDLTPEDHRNSFFQSASKKT